MRELEEQKKLRHQNRDVNKDLEKILQSYKVLFEKQIHPNDHSKAVENYLKWRNTDVGKLSPDAVKIPNPIKMISGSNGSKSIYYSDRSTKTVDTSLPETKNLIKEIEKVNDKLKIIEDPEKLLILKMQKELEDRTLRELRVYVEKNKNELKPFSVPLKLYDDKKDSFIKLSDEFVENLQQADFQPYKIVKITKYSTGLSFLNFTPKEENKVNTLPTEQETKSFVNNFYQIILNSGRGVIKNLDDLKSKAKEAANKIPKFLVMSEEKLLDIIIKNTNDPRITSLALFLEFVQGRGPEKREFKENHPFTISLKNANMTTIALKQFYNGYLNFVNDIQKSTPTHYCIDFKLWHNEKNTGYLKEFVKDGFTAAQFVGSATYFFDFNAETKILNVRVEDTKNHNSLFLHLTDENYARADGKFFGTTHQTYNFSLSLDEVIKRINN